MGKLTKTKNGQAVTTKPRPARGFEEGIDREDITIPRAQLIQSNSPTFQDKPDKFKLGCIYNSISEEQLPELFIPVFKFTNWIRFNPRSKDDPNYDAAYDFGEMIWRSDDATDPRVIEESKWGDGGLPPAATKFLNFFSYFPGHAMPIVISFSRTSMKTGRQLLTLAQFSGGDMFSRKYKLSSKIEENSKGRYYIFQIEPVGNAKPEDFAQAEKLYDMFSDKKIDVHHEEPEFIGEAV